MIGRERLPALRGQVYRLGWQVGFWPLLLKCRGAWSGARPLWKRREEASGEGVLRRWACAQTVTWLGRASWSCAVALPVPVCAELMRQGVTPLCGKARRSKKVLQEKVGIAPEIIFAVLLQCPYGDASLAAGTPTCPELWALQRWNLAAHCIYMVGFDWELLSLGPLFYSKLLCPWANFPHL